MSPVFQNLALSRQCWVWVLLVYFPDFRGRQPFAGCREKQSSGLHSRYRESLGVLAWAIESDCSPTEMPLDRRPQLLKRCSPCCRESETDRGVVCGREAIVATVTSVSLGESQGRGQTPESEGAVEDCVHAGSLACLLLLFSIDRWEVLQLLHSVDWSASNQIVW